MGLCKCARKRMTNLFCFEHHVNVCEECLVHEHSKCVIKSYLNWLEDSDYDPNCSLCSRALVEGECARLVCYHLFHWSCLNRHAMQLAENTAPAGYKCPHCQQGIFPKSNLATPVAEALRRQLQTTVWGRNAFLDTSPTSLPVGENTADSAAVPATSQLNANNRETKISFDAANNKEKKARDMTYETVRRTDYRPASARPSSLSSTTDEHEHASLLDSDDGALKYKRKPFREWFHRLVRAYVPRPSANDARAGMRRLFITVLVILVLLLTFGVFFTSHNRSQAMDAQELEEDESNLHPALHDSPK